MNRDLSKLKNSQVDVLIIGAGIHGAWIALEAAAAGFRVALIEKNDFGHATSANSLKILHGGLRYLQHANIQRMRQSIYSRKRFNQIAPHLIQSVPFMVPTRDSGLNSKWVMACALMLNDLIAQDRNRGVPASNHIPAGKILSRKQFLEAFPEFKNQPFTGGALWYESVAQNTERLILECVLAAAEKGALISNYTKVENLTANRQLSEVVVRDQLTGSSFEVQAKLIINAAGPWLNQILTNTTSAWKNMRWVKAVNLIVRKQLTKTIALGLEGRREYTDKDAVLQKGKRLFFFVPWQGYTMIGTAYENYPGEIDDFHITKEDLCGMIDEANAIWPGANLTAGDISFYHWGLLPAKEAYQTQSKDDIQLEKHSLIFDHEKNEGIKGLISVKGVKYTTAPFIARKLVEILKKKLPAAPKNRTRQSVNFPVSQEETSLLPFLSMEFQDHIKKNYGPRARAIFSLIQENSQMGEPVSSKPPVTRAEVMYGIQKEMACKLSDVVFRRTGMGSAECPSFKTLEETAKMMGKELGWNSSRIQNEIDEVFKNFQLLKDRKKLYEFS